MYEIERSKLREVEGHMQTGLMIHGTWIKDLGSLLSILSLTVA